MPVRANQLLPCLSCPKGEPAIAEALAVYLAHLGGERLPAPAAVSPRALLSAAGEGGSRDAGRLEDCPAMPDDRPIALSDSQMDAILLAAQPIARAHRGAFLEAVAAQLKPIRDPGDGDVGRAIRSVQRLYFDPPLATERAPLPLARKAGR